MRLLLSVIIKRAGNFVYQHLRRLSISQATSLSCLRALKYLDHFNKTEINQSKYFTILELSTVIQQRIEQLFELKTAFFSYSFKYPSWL